MSVKIPKIVIAKCSECVFAFLNTQINMIVCLQSGVYMMKDNSKICNCDKFIRYEKPKFPKLRYLNQDLWNTCEYIEEY